MNLGHTDLEVKLAVDRLALCIDQFEGVRAVAVHVAVAIGQTSVAEQEGHLQTRNAETRTLDHHLVPLPAAAGHIQDTGPTDT